MKRWKRRRLSAAIGLAAVPMPITTPTAWAIDAYLPMFNNFYGTAGTKLDDCMVCHVTSNGGARDSYDGLLYMESFPGRALCPQYEAVRWSGDYRST